MADAFLASVESELGGVPADFARFQPAAVFPGQDVTSEVTLFGSRIRCGTGLQQERGRVVATLAGLLLFEPPNVFWVEHEDHRYLPRLEDTVIGVVTDAFGEGYRVDIAGPSPAQLPVLAFDGATKRNHPGLKPGALVYARVVKTHRDLDPELSCCVKSGPRKDWVTGQSVFGELKGGSVFNIPLSLADRLLDPECAVLMALAKGIAFEVAVGSNGRVWVTAAGADEIALIANCIRHSDRVAVDQIPKVVAALIKAANLKPPKAATDKKR